MVDEVSERGVSSLRETHDSRSRDLRIDFFRGAALLVILVDHFEICTGINWISNYTLREYGPADALDVFIFISGFVFGLTYSRVLDRDGFWAAQKKAFRRAAQLYLTQIGLYFAILAFIIIPMRDQFAFLKSMLCLEAVQSPVRASAYAIALVYQPADFDILPLYILFLLIMPVLLFASQNNRGAVLLGSYIVYSLTQLWPSINLPNHDIHSGRHSWLYDPFSWQFLFVVAMILGSYNDSSLMKYLKAPVAIAISLFVVVAISTQYIADKVGIGSFAAPPLPYTDKFTLGPLRLIYSLCLIHLVATFFPMKGAFWSSRIASPVIQCGRHPLPVFGFGVVVHYLAVCLITFIKPGAPLLLLLELCALSASIVVAYIFEYRKPSARVIATGTVG